MFSTKIAPSPWGIGSPCNTWYLGRTRVIIPNGISIASVVFVWVSNDMLYNRPTCIVNREENLQNCPSPWDFVILPEEDRAILGIVYKKLVKIARVIPELCSRTDRHTQTCSLQYSRGQSKKTKSEKPLSRGYPGRVIDS